MRKFWLSICGIIVVMVVCTTLVFANCGKIETEGEFGGQYVNYKSDSPDCYNSPSCYNCSVLGSNRIEYSPDKLLLLKVTMVEAWTLSILTLFLLIFIILTTFLYKKLKNFGVEGWKALIPIKNLYLLVEIVKVRKVKFYLCMLSVIFFLLLQVYLWYKYVYGYEDFYAYDLGIEDGIRIVSFIPVIIVLFLCDYLLFKSYYRLFRKFGWNKRYSALGMIFFPIGAFVLGFGNFQCQGNKSNKKKVSRMF